MEDAHIVGNVMAAANGRGLCAMGGVLAAGRSIARLRQKKPSLLWIKLIKMAWKRWMLEVKHDWKVDVLDRLAQVGE